MTVENTPGLESAVNNVGNLETKAMTYVGLAETDGATHTDLVKKMSEAFGLEARRESIGHYAIRFAETGFAGIEIARSKHKNEYVRYYSAECQETALPVAGAMLEWSSEQDEIGLRDVMSVAVDKKHRGPSKSIMILAHFLDGRPLNEFVDGEFKINEIFFTRLESLLSNSLITEDDGPRRFRILDPTYRGRYHYENLKPAKRALYEAMGRAKEEDPERMWSADELAEYTAGFVGTDDQRELDMIRREVYLAASIKQPRSYRGAVGKVDLRPRFFRIAPEHEEAIAALIETYDRLGEETSRSTFADRGFEIIGDLKTASKLAKKVYSKDQTDES